MAAQAGADTAGSAKEIADGNLRDVAAICSRLAATRYGLKILQLGIEDNKFNFTRFWVLAKGDAATPTTPKTSVVFAVSDKPGSSWPLSRVRPAQREPGQARVAAAAAHGHAGLQLHLLPRLFGHHADAARDALLGLLSAALRPLPGSYDGAAARGAARGQSEGPVNDPTLMTRRAFKQGSYLQQRIILLEQPTPRSRSSWRSPRWASSRAPSRRAGRRGTSLRGGRFR